MATAKKTPATRKQANSTTRKVPLKKTTVPAAPARPVARKAAKPAVKPAVKPPAAPKPAKPVKAKKPKLVRDSFTIPKAEYVVLEELKQRAGALAHPVKKSELLRAGIKALAAMPASAFLAALANVPAIKTGRPAA